MSEPNEGGPSVSVPGKVYTAAKAVSATIVTVGAVVALAVKQVADGHVSWDEAGELIGAALAAAATVGAVWRTDNWKRRKS